MTRFLRALLAPLAALALSACASLSMTPGIPGPGFTGPHLEKDAFVSFDGARLGLSEWDADGDPWAVIIALHGMAEYGGTFKLPAEHWAKDGVTTLAYDQRGFGRSPGRGRWPGQDLMVQDLRAITQAARAKYPNAVIAVAGVSMGGAAAIAAFASDDPPDADRVVLLAPAVWGWSTQPWGDQMALQVARRMAPAMSLNPPDFVVRDHMPSDNIEQLRIRSRDPLMLFRTRFDSLYGLVGLMETAWRDIGKIKAPTLYLYGAHDAIIPPNAGLSAAQRLSPTARAAYYPDGYHLLLWDLQGEKVWADVEAFLRDPKAPLPSGVGRPPPPSK